MDFVSYILTAAGGFILGVLFAWELATARQCAKNAAHRLAMEMEMARLNHDANYWAALAQREHEQCEGLWESMVHPPEEWREGMRR